MIAFILQNLATILISLALAVIVALVVRKLVRDSRKPGCGCGCSGCAYAEDCGGEHTGTAK